MKGYYQIEILRPDKTTNITLMHFESMHSAYEFAERLVNAWAGCFIIKLEWKG